ncbi:MAG: HlyD family efflux transporter periplasmic adaptor subunit [Clostridiaceae bacterium]|nr:HlyD family efflux transporter periplasmic adaptor subunit [Clostridiaceae bacterium]
MKKMITLLLAIAISCTAAACGQSEEEMTPAASTQTEDTRQTIEAFGTVIPTEVKNITLDFQANVERIHVKEGQRVRSGQPLVTLDIMEMENTITEKELYLAASKNNMERLLEGNDLSKLQNDLKSAKDIYSKSSEELKTKEQLYTTGSISQSELDSFRRIVDSDKKAVQDITYAINSLKNSKGRENEQQSLEASVLEADLKLLRAKFDKPFLKGSDVVCDVNNGIVYDIGYSEGDAAGPQMKLLSIMDADSLEIEANIPEEFIKDIKIGSSATVTPVADKTRSYTGSVSYIPGRAVYQNGETQVAVRIKLDNADDFLLPGFNVDVEIDQGR